MTETLYKPYLREKPKKPLPPEKNIKQRQVLFQSYKRDLKCWEKEKKNNMKKTWLYIKKNEPSN